MIENKRKNLKYFIKIPINTMIRCFQSTVRFLTNKSPILKTIFDAPTEILEGIQR